MNEIDKNKISGNAYNTICDFLDIAMSNNDLFLLIAQKYTIDDLMAIKKFLSYIINIKVEKAISYKEKYGVYNEKDLK